MQILDTPTRTIAGWRVVASIGAGLFAALAVTGCGGEREPDDNAGAARGGSTTGDDRGTGSDPRHEGGRLGQSGSGCVGARRIPVVAGDWYQASSGSVEDNLYIRMELDPAGGTFVLHGPTGGVGSRSR